MWINNKKINFENIVEQNGKIVSHKNVPVMTGIGDSTIWKCTFENGSVFEIKFMPDEYGNIIKNIKH